MDNIQQTAKKLTLKYAGLQAIYWMAVCSIYGFASIYLLHQGFNNSQIGVLLAVANSLSVFLQPALGTLADRFPHLSIKKLLSVLVLIVLAFVAGIILLNGLFWVKAVLFALSAMLSLTLQPLINALGFEYRNAGIPVDFGSSRGAGSLSYAVASSGIGMLLGNFTPDILPYLAIVFYLLLLGMLQLFPLVEVHQKETAGTGQVPDTRLTNLLKRYPTLKFLLPGIVSLFVFHTYVNTYMVQIILNLGGDSSNFGTAITIAALSELPAMLGFSYLIQKASGPTLLKFAAVAFFVRSVLIFASGSVTMIYLVQLTQALGFAIFMPASVYYMNHIMNEHDKVKGQTLLVGSNTLGNVIGTISGGWLIDTFEIRGLLLFGCFAALLGVMGVFVGAKGEGQKDLSAVEEKIK